MLNLLAHRHEFDGLAAAPSSLWPAFEIGDAAALNDFLRNPDPNLKSLLVDFAQSRGNYEARIFDEGVLPVRKKSLHDLFNVLAWRTFPRALRFCTVKVMPNSLNWNIWRSIGRTGSKRSVLPRPNGRNSPSILFTVMYLRHDYRRNQNY